jgi:tRNA(Ser,Leu) C12 N-acetylase TAN1
MFNGFVITTMLNKEDRAYKEFKTKIKGFSNDSERKMTNLDNFTVLLKSEIEELKNQQNFVLVEKCKSILIIKNQSECLPSNIYKWIRREEVSFRYVLRIIPLDLIIKSLSLQSEIPKISTYIKNNKFNDSYKILFEGRFCATDLKEKLFEIIIPLVSTRVNLTNPDFIIVIQSFKSLTGICAIENDFKNFNFSENCQQPKLN